MPIYDKVIWACRCWGRNEVEVLARGGNILYILIRQRLKKFTCYKRRAKTAGRRRARRDIEAEPAPLSPSQFHASQSQAVVVVSPAPAVVVSPAAAVVVSPAPAVVVSAAAVVVSAAAAVVVSAAAVVVVSAAAVVVVSQQQQQKLPPPPAAPPL